MNTLGIFGAHEITDAVRQVEDRLPPDVARQLAHVKVHISRHARGVADAGDHDIRIQPQGRIKGDMAALVAVLAHECAHVVLSHHRALRSGIKTALECEYEADNLARQWGFGPELERRKLYFGR